MDFDHVVIGSGLAALGAVLGLPASQRVLVLAGPAPGSFRHYDQRATVPCAFDGEGGLGSHWHGVIPLGLKHAYAGAGRAELAPMLSLFYPGSAAAARLGEPWLFVPWRPIRPLHHFARLRHERGDRLAWRSVNARSFTAHGTGVEVEASDGQRVRARRLWVAAGVMGTPALLARSVGAQVARGRVDDHVLCYLGLTERADTPRVERRREGLYVRGHYDAAAAALYTLRPARFNFARLDSAIEMRAVFGMPTGSAVTKIMRRASPGLLAEAFYNRFGLFPQARCYSVYAQVPVRDAYEHAEGPAPLLTRMSAIRAAADAARAAQPFGGLQESTLRDIYIPGIHLHHSVNLSQLASAGLQLDTSPVQVVDASVLRDIGPDHHSFKMLVAAAGRAAALTRER